MLSRDGDIADYVQYMATADTVTVNRCDNRLWNIADDIMQIVNFPKAVFAGAIGTLFFHLLLITADAKGLLSRRRQDDNRRALVRPGPLEGMQQFFDGPSAKAVKAILAIDGDGGDTLAHFIFDVCIIHCSSFFVLGLSGKGFHDLAAENMPLDLV